MLMNTDKVFGENNTALNRQFYLNERNLGFRSCYDQIEKYHKIQFDLTS
jgi:hypothetical protein